MRVIKAAIGMAKLALSGNTALATQLGVSDLTGAWHLMSVETIRPNGEIIYPY